MSTDGLISREEHEEFVKRIDEANRRQDKRLESLETTMGQLHTLTASVEKLAESMQHMMVEQEKQGKRLEAVESRDGEQWRSLISHLAASVAGALAGIILYVLGIS